jgi:RNA polymerase sigma-70 factor, ECF subfamily
VTGSATVDGEFEAQRGYLEAVAYRMLGSVSEAQDAVQECWLRLRRADRSAIENLEAWLTRVLARICLDLLGTARARREEYVGSRCSGSYPCPIRPTGSPLTSRSAWHCWSCSSR